MPLARKIEINLSSVALLPVERTAAIRRERSRLESVSVIQIQSNRGGGIMAMECSERGAVRQAG
jgi:hypothetical protein